jgi:uncharacterized Zn finger protein (UPF0148 family)
MYGIESGTCNTSGEDWEYEDSETNGTDYGDTTYRCPECNDEVRLSDLEDADDEDDEDNENMSITQRNTDTSCITDNGTNVVTNSRYNMVSDLTSNSEGIVECPTCHKVNFTDGDGAIICSACNHEIEL